MPKTRTELTYHANLPAYALSIVNEVSSQDYVGESPSTKPR